MAFSVEVILRKNQSINDNVNLIKKEIISQALQQKSKFEEKNTKITF